MFTIDIDTKIKEIIKDIELLTGYEIIRVKRGTRGLVFIARTNAGMPKYVVYKTTIEALENRDLKSFIREARRMFIAAGHPLILTPYYIIKVKGRPLICMRYADMSLREYLIQRGKLDLVEALVLAVQIVKGLLYLKEKGIKAHQDLKPENILLEDLRKIFGNEIEPPLHLRVRIADFGLANAWKEAGIPGGTNPYRAPEQFSLRVPINMLEKYFNPDVFALGIMLVEMITGHHPCGLTWEEVEKKAHKTRFWEYWALNGGRIIRGINEPRLKKLLEQMLNPVPNERPSLEEVYNELMEILKSVNFRIYEQLRLLLEYYDTLAKYYVETRSWIDDLLRLIDISHDKLLDFVLDMFNWEREKVKQPTTPSEAVYSCKLNYAIGITLIRKDKNKFKDQIIKLGREIIDIISAWRSKIKVEHVYVCLL